MGPCQRRRVDPSGSCQRHHDGVGGEGDQVVAVGHEVEPDETGDVGGAWLGRDLGGRTDLRHLTVVEDEDRVGQRQGVDRVVGDQERDAREVAQVPSQLDPQRHLRPTRRDR